MKDQYRDKERLMESERFLTDQASNLKTGRDTIASALTHTQIEAIIKEMDTYRLVNKPKPLEVLLEHIRPIVPNPRLKQSVIKKMFYCWINPLFKNGNKHVLQPKEIYKIPEWNKITFVKKLLDAVSLKIKIKNNHHSPLEPVYKLVRTRYILATLAFTLSSLMQFAAPFLVQEHIKLFASPNHNKKDFKMPILFLSLLGLDLLVRSIVLNHSNFHLTFLGTRFSIALRPMIFEKMLNMNIVHLNYFVETTLVNLMTIDMDNLVGGLMIIPNFCSAFCVLGAQFYFLYSLGWLTLVLIAMLVLVVICFKLIQDRTKTCKLRLLRSNDLMSRTLKEFLRNIVNIKICQFGEVFYRKLLKKKEFESKLFKTYLRWTQAASILNYIFPTLFGLAFFALSWAFSEKPENGIDLTSTYLVLTVLSIMRTPLTLINDGFDRYPDYMVSRKRIETFLTRVVERPTQDYSNPTLDVGFIRFKDASIGCSPHYQKETRPYNRMDFTPQSSVREVSELQDDSIPIILKRVSFHLVPGSRLAILGSSGAGKTFLILSILGEADVKYGSVQVQGSKTFIGRDCSLIEDSIAQNILMGQEFQSDKYNMILGLCHLENLLSGIAAGDQLILKDNGANISLKLKSRVCLARFLYHESDIYLIDEFLDDIEEEFRTFFLSRAIDGYLKGKTVIISTSQKDVCNVADKIIILDNGSIVEQGSRQAVTRSNKGIYKTLIMGKAHESETELTPKNISQRKQSEHGLGVVVEVDRNGSRVFRRAQLGAAISASTVNVYPSITSVRHWKVIFDRFFFNYGWRIFALYISLMVVTQLFVYSFTWFTAAWKAKIFKISAFSHVLIYIGITVAAVLCLIITSKVFIKFFRKISFRLFFFMIRSLIGRDLDWFRKTPASRILNVFVTDYNEVDQLMGPSISTFLQNFVRLNVGVAMMLYKSYITGIPIIIVYLLILRTMYVFLATDRSLKQIFTSNRAHLVTAIMDSHKGIIEYRNSGHLGYIRNNFYELHDIFQNSRTTDSNFAQRWLGVRVYSLVLLLPLLVMSDGLLDLLFDMNPDYMWEGIKFSISFDVCFSAMGFMNSFVKNESFFSDIERIVGYIDESVHYNKSVGKEHTDKSETTDNLLSERAIRVNNRRPTYEAHSFVSLTLNSEIVFRSVSYVYPLFDSRSLRSMSFVISAHQKAVLVGSMASGKHTVMHLIAGLVNPSGITQGDVSVCGRALVPGLSMPKLTEVMFLNADFTLFEGNLRENIDPFHRYSDSLIIKVLEYLGFWEMMVNIALDHPDLAKYMFKKFRVDVMGDEPDSPSGIGRLSFHKHDSLMLHREKSESVEHSEYLNDHEFTTRLIEGIGKFMAKHITGMEAYSSKLMPNSTFLDVKLLKSKPYTIGEPLQYKKSFEVDPFKQAEARTRSKETIRNKRRLTLPNGNSCSLVRQKSEDRHSTHFRANGRRARSLESKCREPTANLRLQKDPTDLKNHDTANNKFLADYAHTVHYNPRDLLVTKSMKSPKGRQHFRPDWEIPADKEFNHQHQSTADVIKRLQAQLGISPRNRASYNKKMTYMAPSIRGVGSSQLKRTYTVKLAEELDKEEVF